MRHALFAALLLSSCSLPRDPHKTLEHVQRQTLTVGVSEDAPMLVRNGDAARGIEAELIAGFAKSIGAKVQWEWGAQEPHLDRLQHYKLDLVAGGLDAKTPWAKNVAVTRPFFEQRGRKYVFAVPPGENAFLLKLEKYLAEHKP